MDQVKKHREWWIDHDMGTCLYNKPNLEDEDWTGYSFVHVIEHAALVEAQDKIKELETRCFVAESDDKKAQAALEWTRGLLDEKTTECDEALAQVAELKAKGILAALMNAEKLQKERDEALAQVDVSNHNRKITQLEAQVAKYKINEQSITMHRENLIAERDEAQKEIQRLAGQVEELKAQHEEFCEQAQEKTDKDFSLLQAKLTAAEAELSKQVFENGVRHEVKAENVKLRSALEHILKGLEMWRKYQSPGNIADVEAVAREALGEK